MLHHLSTHRFGPKYSNGLKKMEGVIFRSGNRHILRHGAWLWPNLDNCCALVFSNMNKSDPMSLWLSDSGILCYGVNTAYPELDSSKHNLGAHSKGRRWGGERKPPDLQPHVQCPKQNPSSLLAWRPQNLWKSSGEKASEILPQMWYFHGSQVKTLQRAWGKVAAAWAEHGKWLPEEMVRLEPVSSRLVTDCSLSHPASTATVTLESVLRLAVAGLRFCLLLCQLFVLEIFLEGGNL